MSAPRQGRPASTVGAKTARTASHASWRDLLRSRVDLQTASDHAVSDRAGGYFIESLDMLSFFVESPVILSFFMLSFFMSSLAMLSFFVVSLDMLSLDMLSFFILSDWAMAGATIVMAHDNATAEAPSRIRFTV